MLRRFYDALVARYGPQRWWPAETAIETVVGAYLTQNTAWRNVERSIANLKEAGVLTVAGLRSVPEDALRGYIRPSGYMVRKSAALKAFIVLLDAKYDSSLEVIAAAPTEETREALLALPGVGPETADAILLYALHRPVMVVDEYLRRIVSRHELIGERARYGDVQQLALQAFATDSPETLRTHYNEFHALVVEVGKNHCGGVPRCTDCPLRQPAFHPPATPEKAVRAPRYPKASE